ncbi:hypothetical protein HXX76_015325 [Chlamydomonas incerta]|uniref:Uncharacterized protein n=1 Tax=Chlamydomonas incerta TaxID=51695 RepID=A0A835SJD2_CHLIN|nr:hypothetical protein HXX76_015325 [Chlamydomonas incerta]|eukprot:KAG2423454.1 hypothetical protein HXX76_015325 [Chlamydomonas incerta]
MASLLEPKPASPPTFILTDCCLSPEADPGLSSSSSASAPASTTSSSISIPRIKAVAPRLGSRISMWVDRAVYECKELRDRIRHGPSRGRGPAPVLTPEQAALARALEDEVFTLAETLPVPLPTTAVAGPKPPRRRSRLAAFLRKMVAALKAALLLKSAAASAPATAATITTDATAGATAAAPIEPTPSLPVSLHASTGGSDGIDGSARSVAGAASVALEVMIDNEQARRVWAQSCPAANGPGSRIDSSSRQPSASSCETADGYSSGNGGRSSSLSALPYSASTSASPSPLLGSAQPSADFPTTYAWLEPQPASPAGGSSSDDEADRSNNEDTSNYAQLAVHASSSSSSAPSDSEADEEAGQRRRRYRQGRLAGGGKSDCGTARVSGWLATSRASSSRARRQQQQQHRQQQQQQALVVAAGYQLVKLARPPATAAAYNGLVG